MAGSPWGTIQQSENIVRGVRVVSTASHSGIMVSPQSAHKYLSEAARNAALRWNEFYCFEEDCDAAIVLSEFVKNLTGTTNSIVKWAIENPVEISHSLNTYNSEYLAARNAEMKQQCDTLRYHMMVNS